MFGNQTLLCQVVLPVRSCAAAIRPESREGLAGVVSGPLRGALRKRDSCELGCFAEFKTIQADLPVSRWQADAR